MIKFSSFGAALAAGIALLAPASHAAVVYSEGFTANTFSPWTQGSSYWSDCGGQGNCVLGSGGQSGAYLRLGTSNGSEPDHRFFISPQFAVTANTDYSLTFWLQDNYPTSSGAPYNVPIQALINGAAVGGLQYAAVGGWNEIKLDWNSGAATTAVITLSNEYQLSGYWQTSAWRDWGYGNDFAVDSISLDSKGSTAVSEPGTLALAGLAFFGLGLRRRAKARG